MEKRKIEDCQALPKGWKREEVIRKSGLSAGKTDVYYYSPCGRKFRSKPQLARFLGDSFDLSAFDFRSGKQLSVNSRKSKRLKNIQYDYSRGIKHDASLVLPIRQTASIFKQPVTLKTNHTSNRTRADPKQDAKDIPKQLFWERRLSDMTACDMLEQVLQAFDLPDHFISSAPGLTDENLLQSLSSSLHLHSHPITGQTSSKSLLDKNPGVYVNIDQPPLIKFTVTDNDIRRQEEVVRSVRERLQKVLQGDAEAIKAEMQKELEDLQEDGDKTKDKDQNGTPEEMETDTPNSAPPNSATLNPATPNLTTPNPAPLNPATLNPATPNPSTPNPANPDSAPPNPTPPNPETPNPVSSTKQPIPV